ncbi:MAG: hypothetical protein IJI26_09705 [Clostridia bacterium]|nr:hypothetical protein [Clostridia bacterium]
MAGSFAVTSCTVSKSIIAPTDTVDITLTIKNVTGSKVVTFGASFYFNSEDLGISSGGWAPTFSAQASVSWANNTSKTFSYSICPDSIMSQPLYSSYYNNRVKPRLASLKTLPFRIMMSGVCSDGSGVGEDYTFSNLRYIDQWYHPVITLDAWRYPDDEGVGLAATMKVELADGPNADRFTATMHYAQDGKATTSSPVFNMNVDRDVLFGVGYSSNTAILPGTFNNGSVFSFLLVVTDGYETVTAQITVDRAFANLHLSGKTTGGVAFGRFSTAQQGVPKFECDYPAYLYGGVSELGMDWLPLTPASGVTSPNSNLYGGGALCVAKVGPHVFIRGSVMAKSGALLTTLPSGYYPTDGNRYKLAACGGSRVARLYVNGAGQLHLEWVRNMSDGNAYTTAVWVDCNFDYWID